MDSSATSSMTPAATVPATAPAAALAPTVLGDLLRLLSVAVQPPTAGMAASLVDGSLARSVAGACADLEVAGAALDACAATMDAYAGGDASDALHELRREHTRLFLGTNPLVENAEGPWRKKAEGKEGVALMVNSYSTEVADFMRYCGVVRTQGYNDCVDYIENELDFAAMLADSPAYLAQRGLDAGELLDRFVAEHLRLWVPGFCADVVAATGRASASCAPSVCECAVAGGPARARAYYAAVCGLVALVVAEL